MLHRTPPFFIVLLLLLGGISFEGFGQKTSGKAYLDSLENRLMLAESDSGRMDFLGKLAYRWRTVEAARSKSYSRQLIQLATAQQDTYMLAMGWRGLAKTHRHQQEYDSARVIFDTLALWWERNGDRLALVTTLNDLGWLEKMRGEPEGAIEYGLKALEINRPVFHRKGLARTYALLGAAHKTSVTQVYVQPYPPEAIVLLRKAMQYEEEALAINLELGNSYAKSAAVILANTYALLNLNQKSFEAYTIADSLCRVYHCDESKAAEIDFNRALTVRDLGNIDFADSVFQARRSFFATCENLKTAYKFFYNYYRLAVEKDNLEMALELALIALDKAEKASITIHELEANVIVAKAWSKLGHHDSAVVAWNKAYRMKVEQDKVALRAKADELTLKYETHLKEQAIQQLELEKQFSALEDLSQITQLRQQRWGLILAGLLIFVLVALLVTLNQRSKARQALAREKLSAGANELEVLRANLQSELESRPPVFKMHSEQKDINEYLLSPLTEREMEVLLLLSEGLSNRAISDRLHISPNTAKTHIARIYDKLDVNNRTQAARKASNLKLLQHLKQVKEPLAS